MLISDLDETDLLLAIPASQTRGCSSGSAFFHSSMKRV